MEVVLGTGEVMRTGDGSLNHDRLVNWHTSKYSCGPILDGLFTHSNFGIVTRIGIWLLPRPPAVQSFHFLSFPTTTISRRIIELARPR
jgi:4-cresol dehydrogenase (hydroxylating)